MPPKKKQEEETYLKAKLQEIGRELNPGGKPVPADQVIKLLMGDYRTGEYLGGASILKEEKKLTSEYPAWAWLEEKGVRGTLNIRTGAFQVPCVVVVDHKYFPETEVIIGKEKE